MIEVRRYNGLAVSWPHVARDHQGVHAWLLSFLQAVGEKLGGATLWLAGICPLHALYGAVLQRFHQPRDPVSCLALIGTGVPLIYIPLYLTASLRHRLPLTTALLIGLGFAAGLAAFCAPYK
jgi:hypothetical protein